MSWNRTKVLFQSCFHWSGSISVISKWFSDKNLLSDRWRFLLLVNILETEKKCVKRFLQIIFWFSVKAMLKRNYFVKTTVHSLFTYFLFVRTFDTDFLNDKFLPHFCAHASYKIEIKWFLNQVFLSSSEFFFVLSKMSLLTHFKQNYCSRKIF